MHSSDFSLFGFFTLRIYLWTDRVNFTSASLLRPDSPSGLSTLSVDIHEDTYRGSQQGSRQPCASRRYLDIYTIEKTFLSR